MCSRMVGGHCACGSGNRKMGREVVILIAGLFYNYFDVFINTKNSNLFKITAMGG